MQGAVNIYGQQSFYGWLWPQQFQRQREVKIDLQFRLTQHGCDIVAMRVLRIDPISGVSLETLSRVEIEAWLARNTL